MPPETLAAVDGASFSTRTIFVLGREPDIDILRGIGNTRLPFRKGKEQGKGEFVAL